MANVDIKLASSTRSSTIRSIDVGTSTPKLSGTVNVSCYTNLQELSCVNNDVTLLSGMDAIGVKTSLERVRMDYNKLTKFPPLTACSALLYFNVDTNVITTNIPNLLPNTALQTFICNNNSIQSWYGNDASISVNLGNFQAQNNLLNMNTVDGILHAFHQRGRNSATSNPCNLFLDGTGNSTPSFLGGVLLNLDGLGFSQSGVTVSYKAPSYLPLSAVCHGLEDNLLYTFLDLSWSLTGTSVVTVDTLSTFSYKVSPYQSSTVSQGTGTATIRYTLSAADGYRDYQILALPTDQAYGGETGRGWDVRINQPAALQTVIYCTPTPTLTPTQTPGSTPTQTPDPTPTQTPGSTPPPTPDPTPTSTPPPTPDPTPTQTPGSTPPPTPDPTPTSTPPPTPDPTPTQTPGSTPTQTPDPTPTSTPPPTPDPTPTSTPPPTPDPTPTPTYVDYHDGTYPPNNGGGFTGTQGDQSNPGANGPGSGVV